MDEKQYISSGILELYVAGALEKEAMLEVSQKINESVKIRTEVKLIESALYTFFKIASPKNENGDETHQLKSRLINRIKNKF